MTITITTVMLWTVFKWFGLGLFILSLIVLFCGDLPDNAGSGFANGLRWVVWPAFIVWIIVILIRGICL